LRKIERIILKTKPVHFVVNKSKDIKLRGPQKLTLHSVSRAFWKQLGEVDLADRASAISFNFLMAIPAATIFLCTLIPYMPISRQLTRQLLILTRDLTPNENTRLLVYNFLNDFLNTPRTGLLSFGFILVIFYSSNAMMRIIRTFDQSVEEKRKTTMLRKRFRAIKLTAVLLIILLASLLILFGQGILFKWVMRLMNIKSESIRFLIKCLRWVVIIWLFVSSLGFIYKFAPSMQKRWKLLSPGAYFATLLIILVTSLFSLWVEHFSNFNKIYGSIGTILIMMLLVFFNSIILLVGFELNIAISNLKKENARRAMLVASAEAGEES
jgi:membrane protein